MVLVCLFLVCVFWGSTAELKFPFGWDVLFRNIRSTLMLVPEQLVVQRSSTKTHKRNRLQTRCFQHHFPIRLEVCTASRSTGWHPLIDFRATRCEKRGAEGSSRLTADWPKAPVWRQDTCCSAATATTSQGGVLARRLSRHFVRDFSHFPTNPRLLYSSVTVYIS